MCFVGKKHIVDFKLISWQCWKNAAAQVSFTAFRKKIYRGRGWIFGFRFSPYQAASLVLLAPKWPPKFTFTLSGNPLLLLRARGGAWWKKRGFNNVGETLSSRRFLWPVRWVNYDFLNLTTKPMESDGIWYSRILLHFLRDLVKVSVSPFFKAPYSCNIVLMLSSRYKRLLYRVFIRTITSWNGAPFTGHHHLSFALFFQGTKWLWCIKMSNAHIMNSTTFLHNFEKRSFLL